MACASLLWPDQPYLKWGRSPTMKESQAPINASAVVFTIHASFVRNSLNAHIVQTSKHVSQFTLIEIIDLKKEEYP